MRAGGGRRIAAIAVSGGLLVGMAFLCVSFESLLESWWVWRLDSRDPEVSAAARGRLMKRGGDGAALVLLHDLHRERNLEALFSLREIYPGLSSRRKLAVIEKVIEYLQRAEEPIPVTGRVFMTQSGITHWFFDGIDFRVPAAYPIFTKALDHPSSRDLAVLLLLRAWPDSRDEVRRYAAEIPLSRVMDLCRAFEICPQERENAAAARTELALHHRKPEVRAIALAHALNLPDLLKKAYHGDADFLVRRTAVRAAGCLGAAAGLDLSALLLSENDPRLLAEIVGARKVWANRSPPGRSFEVMDGLLRGMNVRDARALSWRPKEILRLREILAKETDPALRDAASLAMTPGNEFPVHSMLESRKDSLTIHEWGVFLDGSEGLAPPEKLLGDLPGFVHRSRVSAGRLLRDRREPLYVTGIALKPVLFFYSPEPVVLDVQVRFPMGMPWTFYPEATDYLEVLRTLAPGEGGSPPSLFADLKGIHPPWLPGGEPEGEGPPARIDRDRGFTWLPQGELRSRYELVPWVAPSHGFIPQGDQRGEVDLAGVGLRWRGLRVGYGPGLEGQLRPAPSGSWWKRLRETGSSPVAIRGEHEKFLFYDGVVRLRAPVVASWADAAQSALSLQVRPIAGYSAFNAGTGLDTEEMPGDPPRPIPAVLVIRRSGADLRGALLPNLAPEAGPHRVALAALDLEGGAIRGRLESVLVEEGLTAEEARGLLFAWEKEFLQTEGLRVITVLPGWMYDSLLPLEIRPEPGELVRVGLVWKEARDLPMGSEGSMAGDRP